MSINILYAKILCAMSPKDTSFLDSDNILWKWVEGEWVGKPMIKDPNYSGHRYIWEEEI